MIALLASVALAQEATRLDPPLPVAGEPLAAEIRAFALPAQKIEFLTDDAPERHCDVAVDLAADGSFAVTTLDCPEAMTEDALAATRQWTLSAAGATRLVVRYVLVYSATIATTTLHAEVDPGAAARFEEGHPGLKLVHGPTPKKALQAKLPKAARKAGLGATTCTVRAIVRSDGRVSEVAALGCPEALRADAEARVLAARWVPRTADGIAEDAEASATVSYR